MERWEIIADYNRKARAFNRALFTEKETERNIAYGNGIGDGETILEYRKRINNQFNAMIILPNPDIANPDIARQILRND